MDSKLPRTYYHRKWCLFAFTVISIISTIIMIFVSNNYLNTVGKKQLPKYNDKEIESIKKTAKEFLAGVSGVSIFIQLVGLFGTLKENYCLVMMYAVITMILAGINFASILQYRANTEFVSTILLIIVSLVAFYFAKDIRKLKMASKDKHDDLEKQTPGTLNIPPLTQSAGILQTYTYALPTYQSIKQTSGKKDPETNCARATPPPEYSPT